MPGQGGDRPVVQDFPLDAASAPNIILVVKSAIWRSRKWRSRRQFATVFSTLHTNDAPSAITRLIDMGVKPFLVASSIQAVLAQRLIRILCDKCKGARSRAGQELHEALLGFNERGSRGPHHHAGRGVFGLQQHGLSRSQGDLEMMLMTNEVANWPSSGPPRTSYGRRLSAAGMKSLLDDGKVKDSQRHHDAGGNFGVTQAEGIGLISRAIRFFRDGPRGSAGFPHC